MRFRKIHGAGNDFVLLFDPAPDGEKDWPGERLASVVGMLAGVDRLW
ncbi:hypothetical protein [Streptomyces niveus]|nr:hypothetical protein [Streptomyces niveus]